MTELLPSAGMWACDDGAIRITPDGRPCVFDMIKVLGGKANPYDLWERLGRKHPEVLAICENFQFPGRGQKEVPVAKDKEAAYTILGLLPGEVGARYRARAAKLFVAYLDDPASLANALIPQLTEDQQERLEARLKSIRTRKTFTDVLKEFGVVQQGFAHCTNAIYIPILGSDARGLKVKIAEEKALPVKSINPRDHLSIRDLSDVETAERVAAGQLRRNTIAGNVGVERVIRKSAEYTRRLLDGEIDIPGIG